MIQLKPDGGIPKAIMVMMAALGAFSVANLYYNQALLELICIDTGISRYHANLITVATQVGYALGLLFLVPSADMLPIKKITARAMLISAISSVVIALSSNVWLLWGASLLLGFSSITPQLFIPMATLYSKPENKSRNMGYIASGIMSGILSARVLSGYIGQWLGWRTMFLLVAVFMTVSLIITIRFMPEMKPTFSGNYKQLMSTVFMIFKSNSLIRFYTLRPSMSFASMLSLWSCLAYHLAGEPFKTSSQTVGLFGLCGLAAAAAASGIGKYVPKFGVLKMSIIGSVLQLFAWTVAYFCGLTYLGLISAIILADIGAQFIQISNQSKCLQTLPKATNRVNTIFMTTFFLGGSLGTLFAGLGWNYAGWNGVCLAGLGFASLGLMVSIFKVLTKSHFFKAIW